MKNQDSAGKRMLIDRAQYRLIKIAGNASKLFSRSYHLVFKERRFNLPKFVPAGDASTPDRRIQKIIWQTNYTPNVTIDAALNFRVNRWFAPDFEFHFVTDEERGAFIRKHFPGRFSDAYDRLKVGAAKADLWRVLVLYVHGGIYLDIDANLAMKPSKFLGPDQDELVVFDKSGKLTNYFLASSKGNPKFLRVAEQIVANIEAREIDNVFHMTGPAVFWALHDTLDFTTRSYKPVVMHGQITVKELQYADKGAKHYSHAKTVEDIVGP